MYREEEGRHFTADNVTRSRYRKAPARAEADPGLMEAGARCIWCRGGTSYKRHRLP